MNSNFLTGVRLQCGIVVRLVSLLSTSTNAPENEGQWQYLGYLGNRQIGSAFTLPRKQLCGAMVCSGSESDRQTM